MEKPVKQIHSAENKIAAQSHVAAQPETAAFDAAAASYDADSLTNPVMLWLRRENLRNLRRCFRPGDRLIEIGCGSGAEALALARLGMSILATDAAPRMVGVLSEKLTLPANSGLAVEPRVLSAEQLSSLKTEYATAAFDGAYSSLGPLNCVQDLRDVASNLAYLVRPGGVVAISVLGKYCLWETAWYLAHGRPSLAFRRWRGKARGTAVAGGPLIDVYYWPVYEVEACFAPYFAVRSRRSLPWALPPTYAAGPLRRYPQLGSLLASVERATHDKWPFYILGDHVYLEMVRR